MATLAVAIDRLISQLQSGEPIGTAFESLRDLLDGIDSQKTLVSGMFTRFVNPDAAATTGFATQKDLTGVTEGFSMAGLVSPDYPRNISATGVISNGAITLLTITVTGTDINGTAISEVLTIDADETVTGSKAFATLTSIAVTGTFSTGGGAGDTLDIGIGVKFGLAGTLSGVKKTVMDTVDVAVAGHTINTTYNTIQFATAPNATHDYSVWYSSYFSSDTTD